MISCSSEYEHSNQDKVFLNVLPVLIDSIRKSHQIDNELIVHAEDQPSTLKNMLVVNALKELRNQSEDPPAFLINLEMLLDKKVQLVDFNEAEFVTNLVFVDQLIERDADLYGSVSLTQVSFDVDEHLGCFYFCLQCGNDCGFAQIILVKKKSAGWIILDKVDIANFAAGSQVGIE